MSDVTQSPISAEIQPSLFARMSGLWHNGWAVARAAYYLRGATEVGAKVRIWGRPRIKNWGTMIVGERVRLVSTIATMELVAGGEGTLEIGAGTFINYGCSIAANQLVRLGRDCNIGTHVIIMDNQFHRIEPERRHEKPASKPVILEDNVWLGARVIVMPGVTIGADSVVGAGSVVTKDIPPRSVAAGQPARVIRTLP